MTNIQKIITTITILIWAFFSTTVLIYYFASTNVPLNYLAFCRQLPHNAFSFNCYSYQEINKYYNSDQLNHVLFEDYKVTYDFNNAKKQGLSDIQINEDIAVKINNEVKMEVRNQALQIWIIGTIVILIVYFPILLLWKKK